MERKRGITVHWPLLLIVYLAVLFATAMVSLTSDSMSAYMLALLAAGVPIYVLASGAIMKEQRTVSPRFVVVPSAEAKIVPFPGRRKTRAPADIPPSIDAHDSSRRKLG